MMSASHHFASVSCSTVLPVPNPPGIAAEAPLAEPGEYTLTMTVGDRTFTRTLTVERVGELTGDSSPFEEEWSAFLKQVERLERAR